MVIGDRKLGFESSFGHVLLVLGLGQFTYLCFSSLISKMWVITVLISFVLP